MWRSQRLMYGNNIKDWETRRSEVSSKRRKTFNDYNRDSLKTKNKINSRGVKKIIDTGTIYKITNTINGKIYVGQTTKTIEQRFIKHKGQIKDGSALHNAMLKYGVENFVIESIETNINKKDLNSREIYWIQKLHSCYLDYPNVGYNKLRGGSPSDSPIRAKLSKKEVCEIQELLANTDMSETEIAAKYNMTIYAISDINRGASWKDDSINYPIRHKETTICTYEMFIKVIKLLQLHVFSSSWIASQFNLAISTVSKINTGIYEKFKYPDNISFPIQPQRGKDKNVRMSSIDKLKLMKDMLTTKTTIKELSIKYNIIIIICKSYMPWNR